MKLNNICKVTEDVAKLRDFYSDLLNIPCDRSKANPVHCMFEINS
jgi:GTP1/Obg family GTP-binding protein